MSMLTQDLVNFLYDAPTSWHAAIEMGNRLAHFDYTPLTLEEKWKLEKGKKYFVTHGGSFAAFVLPEKKPERMAICTSHTDSPALKLKPYPQSQKKNMLLFGVEVYGGPLLHTWLCRDLAIAGRVVVLNQNQETVEHLVYFDDAPLFIPLIAPHLDRDVMKNLELNKQEHLVPIATLSEEKISGSYLEDLLKSQISYKKLLDFDLFLVPIELPRFMGGSSEMLASYRIDNLVSAHAAIVALGNLEKAPKDTLPLGIFWDHEEVGSQTSDGASSTFFLDIFDRISEFYKLSQEERSILRAKSLCVSCDNTHAFNPNYEKKYDPNHQSLLGGGVVIKYNADMRYTSNARSGSAIIDLCERNNLKVQRFVNRSDNKAGSTVGPIFSTQMGIETVDIGIPQLSMHAAREVIACQDHIDLCMLLTQFLQE